MPALRVLHQQASRFNSYINKNVYNQLFFIILFIFFPASNLTTNSFRFLFLTTGNSLE